MRRLGAPICASASSGATPRTCRPSPRSLNNPEAKGHVPGGKVVAAYKGGSADIPSSISRVEEYSKTLQEKYGVKFYDSIEEMCKDVDAVLLESVDGRPHLEQVKPVLQARKPVFIDKPMAASLKDVIEIFRLAQEAKVPVFSSSSLRFGRDTQAVRNGSIGKVTYAETYGPCHAGAASSRTCSGMACTGWRACSRSWEPAARRCSGRTTPDGKIEVVGTWSGGRKGIYREDKEFHGLAKGEKGEAPVGSFDGYEPLVAAIMKFFQTGVAPVQPEETIEIMAFMEAADESKKQGGAPVKIDGCIPAESR